MRPPTRRSVSGGTGAVFLGFDTLQTAIRCLEYISRGKTAMGAYPLLVAILLNPFTTLIALVTGWWLVYRAMAPGKDAASRVLGPSGETFAPAASRNWIKVSGWFMAIGVVLAAPAWYFFIRVPIAPEFKHIYAVHRKDLGEPLRSAEYSTKTYQAVFGGAVELYMGGTGGLSTNYVLPLGPGKISMALPDNNESRGRYFCDEWIRRQLDITCGPPIAGMASLWVGAPQQWAWMGCRSWHRLYHEEQYTAEFPGRSFRPIIYQRFEHGELIGRLNVLPASDPRGKGSEVIGIIRGGTWFSEPTPDEPASSVDATPPKQQCDPHSPLW
jgi:hypothetical protein